MERHIAKRKRKGSKSALSLGHKSKKYRLHHSGKIETGKFDFNFAVQPESMLPVVKKCDSSTQTAVIECIPVFTQTENRSPSTRNKFTQSEMEEKSVKSNCTQYTSHDYFSHKQSQSIQNLNAILDVFNDPEIGMKFGNLVAAHEQTKKFISTIKSLATGRLKCSNMAWKAALDMGYLSSCDTTSTMVYDKEWLEYCQVIYHMFGGGIINTLQGRAHFSHVTSERTKKGIYKPIEGEFNFPVPSINTLTKLDIGYPTEVPVGIIQHSLDLASERAMQGDEFILSFDGKLISPGCKGKTTGDCDMWGREGSPNLQKALRILEHTIKSADNLKCDLKNRSLAVHANYLEHLLLTTSHRLKRLRQRITGLFYLRKKLIACVGDNAELQNKYKQRMSTLNHNTAECESVVCRLLEVNLKITEILAQIRKNIDVHVQSNSRHIKLSEQTNAFSLLPPEIVSLMLDLTCEENSQYIKQGSTLWHEIRSSARVTGSTMRTAIGLETLTKQKEHFHVKVVGREPLPPSAELQKMFDHGKQNEVNATATLTSTVAPALLCNCYAFFEVGPKFIHHTSQPKLMVVSPDGIFMCTNGGTSCPYYNIHGDQKILVEIKSPFPSNEVPETVYYDVPTHHVPQLLAEMKAYECSELWLVCSIKTSSSIIQVHFDQHLWELLWSMACELYMQMKNQKCLLICIPIYNNCA